MQSLIAKFKTVIYVVWSQLVNVALNKLNALL